MKTWQKWTAAVVATFVTAWFIATLLGVVAAQHDQKVSNAEQVRDLEAQLDDVRTDNAANKAAVDELNRRCAIAANCVPVRVPEPEDDAEVQDGEIQEPEIQEPELQEPERQQPEVDDAPIPGAVGAVGASCVAELGLEACRGPAGKDGTNGTNGIDGKDGAPGTAQPGTYACPAGEYLTGFGVAADGSVSLACASANPGNSGGNQ
ncbi:hypothetical protein [Nocardioides sp. WS12]|uniref:hypothetical protein n=1 Tax=Nocardioides sp. WS12 TaxID=2486272 RepID=UPI0015F7AFD2|nr:hypothetical protein [Nocardioides sp. WS12]